MKYILILIFSFNCFKLNAQVIDVIASEDSMNTDKSFVKSSIIPLSLISIGVIASSSQFEKDLRYDIRDIVGKEYQFGIDDYLIYVPVIEMYVADAFHLKAKNHWFDQTKYLLISNTISVIITNSLKRIVLKRRPDLSSRLSFPSNHTSFAFANASVLMHEFRTSAPILAYSGFVFSTTTGVFRMANDKHWISDVIVGAGIGLLTTELVYHFEPFKNFNPFKFKKNINFVPLIDQYSQGFYFTYTF